MFAREHVDSGAEGRGILPRGRPAVPCVDRQPLLWGLGRQQDCNGNQQQKHRHDTAHLVAGVPWKGQAFQGSIVHHEETARLKALEVAVDRCALFCDITTS